MGLTYQEMFSRMIERNQRREEQFLAKRWPGIDLMVKHPKQEADIIAWLKENVEGFDKHVLVHHYRGFFGNARKLGIKFRHEKDLFMFKMVWQ